MIEQFVTHPPVKLFDERVLSRLLRGYARPIDLGGSTPLMVRFNVLTQHARRSLTLGTG